MRLAVVRRLGLDLQVDVDPRLLGVLLDRLSELWDLLVLLGEQRRVDARMPGLLQQLLGHGDVLRALRDGGVGRGEPRSERIVVGHTALTTEQGGNHSGPVQRIRDRLADLRVVERRLVVAHRQLAVVGGLELDDLVSGAVQQLGRTSRDELRDHVDVAALQRQDHRLLTGVELERGSGKQRLGAPVVGVWHERGTDVLLVAAELERAGSHERLLPLAEVRSGGNDDRVVVVRRDEVGEVPVRRLEMKLDRRGIDLLDACGRQHAGERRQGVGRDLRVRQLLEGVDDVVGGHRLAVVELHPGPQLERPHAAVGVGLPAQREHRLQRELQVAVEDQELAGLVEHQQTTRVGDRERVDRGCRRDARDPKRAALLARRRRGAGARGRRRRGAPARGENRAEQRHRHADHAAPAQEVAPVHVTRDKLVDVVVLQLRPLAAQSIQLAVATPH